MKKVEKSDYSKLLDLVYRVEMMGHNNDFVRKVFQELEGKRRSLMDKKKWSQYMSEYTNVVYEYMMKEYSVQGILSVVRDNMSESDRLLLSEGILDIIKETRDGKISEITSKF